MYKTGIAWGCWDGLSEAHLEILKQARENCERLIVGVSDDEYIRLLKHKEPILDWPTRMLLLSKFADVVIPQSGYFNKKRAVDYFRPDVIFVGAEYEDSNWQGEKLGVPVHYIKHNKGIHSTQLRTAII